MAYRLAMSGEMRDWLKELCETDPESAERVGRALTAVVVHEGDLGPPVVTSVKGLSAADDVRALLDRQIERRLDVVAALRRRVADATTLVKDIESGISVAVSKRQADDLRALLTDAQAKEHALAEQVDRIQWESDAVRVRNEALKARYAAASAQREIAERTGDADGRREAARTLRRVTREIERETGSVAPADGLLEVRPGGSGDGEIRMFAAVEPAATLLLIAALEGEEAIAEQRGAAIEVASNVLRRARAGTDPDASEYGYDLASFVGEFFPGRADRMTPRRPQSYLHGEMVVVIDCSDLDRSEQFWSQVLGFVPGGTLGSYLTLLPADGVGIEVLLQRVPDQKVRKNRLHLDLRTRDAEAEVERACQLGATLITSQPIVEDGWRWHVLADPDGNEFCVIQPPPDPESG